MPEIYLGNDTTKSNFNLFAPATVTRLEWHLYVGITLFRTMEDKSWRKRERSLALLGN